MRPSGYLTTSWGRWFTAGLLVFAALAIAAFIISLIEIVEPDFRGKTDFEPVSLPTDPDIWGSTLNIGCTNKTYGTNTRIFKGTTYVSYRCPVVTNACFDYVCLTTGDCEQTLASGAECWQNAMCGNSSRCDLNTCSCVADMFECAEDEDCTDIVDTTCQSVTCISGRCVRNTTAGMECGSSANCDSGLVCDGSCSCVPADPVFTMVEYFPNLTSGVDTFDFENPNSLQAFYIDYSSYVRVELRLEVNVSSETSNQDLSFTFDLPPGLPGNTTLLNSGIYQLRPLSANITGDPTTTLMGHGEVTVSSTTTGLASAVNSNPDYTGPTTAIDTYSGSLYLTYQKM